MTNLMSYAEKLAESPPTKVYTRLMQLVSQEQVTGLTKAGPENHTEEARQQHELELANAKGLADNWNQMVKSRGNEFARFKVSSICDFSAMCMMMIAAGSDRVEQLKTAIRGQKVPDPKPHEPAVAFTTAAKDCAYLIKHGGSVQFRDVMKTWAQTDGNGVVQFKFPACGDFHTFAVERAPNQKNETGFILYQSYQNLYDLSHFLGTRSVWNDPGLVAAHKATWEGMKSADKTDFYKGQYEVFQQKVLSPQMTTVDLMRQIVGTRQSFTYEQFEFLVVDPIAEMLQGQLIRNDYRSLTGSSTISGRVSAQFVIVLMCNRVSTDKFDGNFAALYNCPDGLTQYAICG